jgi:gliding motility-associated-like protein
MSYCLNDITQPLSATGNFPLVWYDSTGTNIPGAAPLPVSTSTGVLVYFVSQVNGNCEGPKSRININIKPKPDLGQDEEVHICYDSSADLTPLFNTTGLSANWTTNGIGAYVDVVRFPGVYQLQVVDSAGCMDTAFVRVHVQSPVVANAGIDAVAEPGIPFQLQGSGGDNYFWSPPGVLNSADIPNPVANLNADTEFILEVSDDFGCKDTDTVNIRVLKGPTFYVPSAFTPNNDGLNDVFRPTGSGIAELKFFRVYNRYGEMIFQSSDIKRGWDGTFKRKKQDTGNYLWMLHGIDRFGNNKNMAGYVVLIR